MSAIEESDKAYWHQFISFYENELANFECKSVLEFGVWRGGSIRWLMDKYPKAKIYGADIIPIHASWPQSENIEYFKVDQGEIDQIKNVFTKIDAKLDLIIEDGSHIPEHQRNSLVESISHIRTGGIYILEDIHTSHPNHPYYRKSKKILTPLVGPLHFLLAIDHLKVLGDEMLQRKMDELSQNSLFDRNMVEMLYDKIESVKIFKRTKLPIRCFSCGKNDFNYARLKCKCGIELFAETDSMSALLRIK